RRDRKGSEPAEELATLPSIRIPQRHRHDLGSRRFNSNLSRALRHHSRGAKLSSQSSAPRFQASSLAQIDPVSLRPAHVEVSPPRAGVPPSQLAQLNVPCSSASLDHLWTFQE